MTAGRNVWVLSVLISLAVAGLGCHPAPLGSPSGDGSGGGAEPAAEGGDEPCDDLLGEDQGDAPDDVRGDVLDPADPSLEVDPQVCQVDSDCMVGTPRDCCTTFCPGYAVAWSHDAWAAYQEQCAVVECAIVETLACPDEREPPPSARCVRERCVLR